MCVLHVLAVLMEDKAMTGVAFLRWFVLQVAAKAKQSKADALL